MANEKANSEVVAQFVRIAGKARLNYDDFLYISQQAHKKPGLPRPKKKRRLPHLLPGAELKPFFRTMQDCGNVQQEILLKLFFYTAVRERAGITQPFHPHLFRHQMLTYLTAKGSFDAQIQLISGHESKKSLEVYQHLSPESVEQDYQDAVRSVGI